MVVVPTIASAHTLGSTITRESVWRAWTFEPAVVGLLAASALAYVAGVVRIWRAAGTGQGIRQFEVAAFAAGWLSVAIALVSPIDAMGSALFSAHMVQHELLMLVAAPLIALGAPFVAFAYALPRGGRWLLGSSRNVWLRRAAAFVSAPAVAWLVHAAAIWAWHAPRLFDAAVRYDAVHAAQHASFFGSALLFWWGLAHGRYGRLGYGAAVLYVFTTTLYTGVLGALLTVSPRAWYGVYATTTAAFGLTPLEDQQIGGLVMWVPAGVIYTAIGLVLFALWLRESERRTIAASRALRTTSVVLGLVALTISAVACGGSRRDIERDAAAMTGGDIARGKQALASYGCVTCHTIPGIREADAVVGPPLTRIASRVYLAGHLPNTPDNMIRWIRHPRAEEPHTAMPDTGVTDGDARDIAAFLYTLR